MPKANISPEISKAILDVYESNKQTLELLEVEGVDSDFEEGYNNALEYVMKLLDIKKEKKPRKFKLENLPKDVKENFGGA